jgi:hypothetical protein
MGVGILMSIAGFAIILGCMWIGRRCKLKIVLRDQVRRLREYDEHIQIAKDWQAESALAKCQQRLTLCEALLPSAPSVESRLDSIGSDLVTSIGLEVLAIHMNARP